MAAKEIVLPADRAYVDFENLYRWHTGKSFFVARLKKSVKFKRLNERGLPEDRYQHILVDEYIELSEEKNKSQIPEKTSQGCCLGRSKPSNLLPTSFPGQQTLSSTCTKQVGTLSSFSKTLYNS